MEAFSFAEALRRLCTRCPAAAQQPGVALVLGEQGPATPQQCLQTLQALLVQYDFTLAAATLFRPMLLKAVAGLVELMTGVGQLPSRSLGSVQPGPELAVALITLLEMAPHVEGPVLEYFQHAPPPFLYLLTPDALASAGVTAAQLARSTLRGLQLLPQLRWQVAPALLVLLQHADADVRWCAAECAALTFGLKDATQAQLVERVLSEEEGVQCRLRWQNERAMFAAELAVMYSSSTGSSGGGTVQPDDASADAAAETARPLGSAAAARSADSTGSRKRKHAEDSDADTPAVGMAAAAGFVNVCGLELPHRQGRRGGAVVSGAAPFVRTPAVDRNLEALALGLCLGSPILLEGPPGSGKSALIEHVAELTGNAEAMVRIHLDDQMDSKSLTGAYVCTSRPGEFVWQPGPLTQAVAQGRWVLVEDVNLAPAEVLAALAPLLERRVLTIASRAETVAAAPGFQLIATVTSAPGGTAAGAYGSSLVVKDLLGGLFHYVAVEPPPEAEQQRILAHVHPQLTPLLPHAMDTLSLMRAAYGQQAQQQQPAAVASALAAVGIGGGHGGIAFGFSVGRHFSIRDVLKWCRRMCSLHGSLLQRSLKPSRSSQYRASITAVPIAVRDAAFVEAADCFCALVGRFEAGEQLLQALAALWALPPAAVQQYTALHKPAVQAGGVDLAVGRATLPLVNPAAGEQVLAAAAGSTSRFAATGHALRNMERVAAAACLGEPVLLVGETGTGKTTLVQQIAKLVGAKLVVLNLSQQTDSSDLLGGFRPIQPAEAVAPLLERFADLVRRTWWRGNNDEFLGRVARLAEKRKWGQLVRAFRAALDKVALAQQQQQQHAAAPGDGPSAGQGAGSGKKQKRSAGGKKDKATAAVLSAEVLCEWRQFGCDVMAAEAAATAAEGGFAFAFVEGALVKAVREGWWLLLDEMNLAPAEALERIAGLLEESGGGSLVIAERGDSEGVPRHPSFRLFGAMNPATDAGKRDLPAPLRNRFTEIWVGEPPQREDLAAIVAGYLCSVVAGAPVQAIVDFYLGAKAEAEVSLQDGAGHKPAYNLRTLCRALEYAAHATPTYGLQRSLWDGFAMSFLTQLDPASGARLEKLMQQHLLGPGTSLKVLLRAPPAPPGPDHVLFDQFWVGTGGGKLPAPGNDGGCGAFVLTPTVQEHLRNLARAVLLRRYPILLQGPTSSGKTSLVAYLAAQTGHAFVRINNHEQTDLQEYLGTYVSDESGRLVFQEGLLVQAVRKGHWIVLDELNLAPTEVLEALNRLLDDNRELYVPELQEVVRPHPHFMLFATQNPPGIYAGRKTLSRAFRSRFLELHVDDIPDAELSTILEKRCAIAPSYAAKLVAVQRELQRRRAASNVFAGRHGFITPRDLFRWAGRGAVGYQLLAEDGFAVLGERLRSAEERGVVQEVLQKVLGAKLDLAAAYQRRGDAPLAQLQAALAQEQAATKTASEAAVTEQQRSMKSVTDVAALQAALGGVVWTASMRRMYCLLERCLEFSEPALLCGETGTGKTTVCQMAAFVRGQRLHIINCNQHTEVSDFLGGFRPNRHRDRSLVQLQQAVAAINASPLLAGAGQPALPLPSTPAHAALQEVVAGGRQCLEAAAQLVRQSSAAGEQGEQTRQLEQLRAAVSSLAEAVAGIRAPFEWADGPLVQAMRCGDMILVDELNLAEDAVLERLNSVLEPGRSLTLAEKGGSGAELVVAHPAFRIVATMNPGGDYGKKELSPALSNRFTSIWVPAIEDTGELLAILGSRLADAEAKQLVAPLLLEFWRFFRAEAAHAARQALSVRDLLAWAGFINATAPQLGVLPAYAHGAHLVLLDGIGLGVGLSAEMSQHLRDRCHAFLLNQLPDKLHAAAEAAAGRGPLAADEQGADDEHADMELDGQAASSSRWGISPFFVDQQQRAQHGPGSDRFSFQAPTTGRNALRVLRALQLKKPVLLEGSPGVGKTSLIAAMAKAVGAELVRINLSEQTDMMDLLGADLPVAGGAPGEFAWADGPLLAAVRSGAWVLLDELNLASQMVLEGLNAVLDHRAEVFIPELNRTFRCPATFRVFGAQNPLQEGGGRKGLPKSFLNRFTRVHVELLQQADLLFIAGELHPRIPAPTLRRMVAALQRLHHDANVSRCFAGAGGPWEFNLRDLLRWCELAESAVPAAQQGTDASCEAESLDAAVRHYAALLFVQRLRTADDRAHAAAAFDEAWELRAPHSWQGKHAELHLSCSVLHIGWASLPRRSRMVPAAGCDGQLALLPSQLPVLESLVECAARGWMCLLVGPAAGGKTVAIRTLASLCGQPLLELSLTSGTDTSDLLGGFEQVEPARKVQELAREVQDLLCDAAGLLLPALSSTQQPHQQLLQLLSEAWQACEAITNLDAEVAAAGMALSAGHTAEAQHARHLAAVHALQQVVAQLLQLLSSLQQPSSGLADTQQQVQDAERAASGAAGRAAELAAALAGGAASSAGKFEWVDGALTRAIEGGQWVLLDSANLCNPTVLDRLNPLLEPQGVLLLNECGGIGEGGARIVRPHPNFRLFLALDPRHGEMSRAMRNRGIEIFLLPAQGEAGAALPAAGWHPLHTSELQQALAIAGVPGTALPAAMSAAHSAVAAQATQLHRLPPGLRELQRWAALAAALAARGWRFETALHTAWRQVYERTEAATAHADGVSAVARAAFDAFVMPCLQQGSDLILYRPAAWPHPLGTVAFAADSAAACMMRDAAVMLQHLAVLAAAEQPSSSVEAVQLGAMRERWVYDFGLAAAAATPASQLVRLLAGLSAPPCSSGTAAATDSSVQMALWCAPAAARVFVERCWGGPAQRRHRIAHAAALADQLGRLIMLSNSNSGQGSHAMAMASQMQQLVSGLLTHPLTAAAAALQQQVATAVHVPAAMLEFLPVNAAAAHQMERFLLAAGVGPNGVAPPMARLWQQVLEVSGKLAGLYHAVGAAISLCSAAELAEDAVAAGSPTLLQLSCWRYERPTERARKAAAHPVVDWLYAVLLAVQRLEEALLVAPGGAGVEQPVPTWNTEVVDKLSIAQQWRWGLMHALHTDVDTSEPAALLQHFERLLFGWMRLRKSVVALLVAVGDQDSQVSAWTEAQQRWAAAAEQLDVAAGIAAGAPPKPLLWKHGGRPLLPRSLALSVAYTQLLSLCDATRVSGAAFVADHRGQPAVLAAAGVQVPLLDAEGEGVHLGVDERRLVAEAVAADIATDAGLRGALLEGFCLFVSGALLAQQPGQLASAGTSSEAQLLDVLSLLLGKVQQRSESVAAAAALLLKTRVALPTADENAEVDMDSSARRGGAQEAHGVLVPMAQLTWGDEMPAGQLPSALPAELMQFPSCRRLQLQLLALQDAQLTRTQLQLLTRGGLLRLLFTEGGSTASAASGPAASDLAPLLAAMTTSGARSVAETAAYQLLSWLLNAHEEYQPDDGNSEWQRLLLRSLVHEAWWRWQEGLWSGAAVALPAAHAGAMAAPAQQQWAAAAAGPLRLHIAAGTALASGITSGPATLIADRSARLLQLKLAARQLRAATARCGSCGVDAAASWEWQAAGVVAAVTIAAHLPSIADREQREQLRSALCWMVDTRCAADSAAHEHGSEDARLLALTGDALRSSSHPVLQQLLQPVLLPALTGLLEGSAAARTASSRAGVLARGRVWALLALLRLHLVQPPAGADPAGKYDLVRQHVLDLLRFQLRPELAVRRQCTALPGSPDEAARIARLEARCDELDSRAERLQRRSTPRPAPPQYLELRDDVARFISSFGSVPRLLETLEQLSSSSGEQAAAGAKQAAVWQQNATAWAERLGQRYPLYRDVVQPVRLAVRELQYGLAMMAGRVQASLDTPGSQLAPVMCHLMAFPRAAAAASGRCPASVRLDSPLVQRAVADAAAAAAEAHWPLAADAGGVDLAEQAKRRTYTAAMSARLQLLRCSLAAVAKDAQASRLGSLGDATATAAVQQRLHTIFMEFVGAWEDLKAEEERRAAAEAEVFKHKTRSTDIASEEKEDEEDYQRSFPDQFALFADLAPDEQPDTLAGASETVAADAAAAAAAAADAHRGRTEQGAAVLSARELVLGSVLQELVAVHATCFGAPADGAAGLATASTASLEFLRSYELGVQLLRASGLVAPVWVDAATGSGQLYAACCHFRQLAQAPSRAPTAGAGVDIQAACVEEAVLVQQPALALRQRLRELLEEWPEHPGLLQLSAVIDRLLGMAVTAPLKAMLTGVELLLAKAQLWEETAARHVSLAPQLAPLSALATRWRKLELVAWQSLLDTTRERAAAVAHQAWFHLYRILLTADDLGAAEVAPTVEQFMQSSPLGEFGSRLALLEAFHHQLAAMSAAAPAAAHAQDQTTSAQQDAARVRWQQLSALLYNVVRYYRQFAPAVQRQVASGMAELEKALRDFVALAKWEDRGYYALRVSNEKAQRQLHRLTRRALQLLREPATAALATAAKGMGFLDLQQQQQEEQQAEQAADTLESASKKRRGAKRLAAAAAEAAAAERTLAEPALAAAAVDAVSQQLVCATVELPAPALLAGSRYAAQMPRLTRRFAQVAMAAVGVDDAAACAAATDDLAGEAARRALELRMDVAKGAKARKKKALTDCFRALAAAGVSRRRSAVPASQRGSQAWFTQAAADPSTLLAHDVDGSPGAPWQGQEEQASAAQRCWAKADRYYFASMARLQRLWEAAKHPHGDLSGAEVEGSVRSVEHLLWLTQRSRTALASTSLVYSKLGALHAALASLDIASSREPSSNQPEVVPPQKHCWAWYQAQRGRLAGLLQHAEETSELLDAAATAETAAAPRKRLLEGARKAAAAASALRACADRLAGASRCAVSLPASIASSSDSAPDGRLFLPGAVLTALRENTAVLLALLADAEAHAADAKAACHDREGLPGWSDLVAAIAAAAQDFAAADFGLHSGSGPGVSLSAAHEALAEHLEAAVAAALVWAQNAKPAAAAAPAPAEGGLRLTDDASQGGEAEQQPLPELLEQLEQRLSLRKAADLAAQTTAVLAAVAAASDASGVAREQLVQLQLAAAGLAPLLGLLRCTLRQLGLQYLAVHKATAKLCYISASLFAGVVQEGFCMPEGTEGEAEDGGEGKATEGTGLGEGDTTGAKDISNELEDQDQLLGAKQKGEEEQEQHEQEDQQAPQDQEKQDQGVEMDDDFEGALEDVQGDQQQSGDDSGEEEGEERLDQQMGETGPEGEDVDERLWNDEDKEQEQQGQEQQSPDDRSVQVGDKSQLDYAAGSEEDAEQAKEDGRQEQAQEAGAEDEQPQPQPGVEEEQDEEELGDYQDRPEDRGHVQPEGAEPEFELPDDLNLDGADAGAGEEDEQGADADEDDRQQPEEQGGAFPEQQPAAEGEEDGGADAEMEEAAAPGGDAEVPTADEQQPEAEPGQQQAGEAEGMEEEQPDEPELAAKTEGEGDDEQEEQAEAGPLGLPSAAATAAGADQGTGAAEQQDGDEQQPPQQQAAASDMAAAVPASAAEPPPGAGGSATGASDGLQDDPAAAAAAASGTSQQQQRQQQLPQSDANPFRNLGNAMERWRARLNIAADAPDQQLPDEGPDAAPAGMDAEEQEPAEADKTAEYRFVGQQEQHQAGDAQALAPATEEQARQQAQQQNGQDEDAGGGLDESIAAAEEEEAMGSDQQGKRQQQQLMSGTANWGAGADRNAGVEARDGPQQDAEEEAEQADDEHPQDEAAAEHGGEQAAADESYVAAQLQAASLEDGPAAEERVLGGLSEEQAAELRQQLDARLRAASEGSAPLPDAAAEAHGRDVWARCEMLTAGLVGELAEQLRLILEPTLASRLAGDYRSGKRISMKKVIGYIASHFRKDKIWMRRTRPDKRKYQVVVAVDDSRSMAETGCGGFALEALALICRAMARLEVGELGVVSFGGGGGALPLHPLERPFTDADGVRVMSQMRFDQDNTISDRPMVDVLTGLDHMLDTAAARAGASAAGASLRQLVLIIADGRFHEKESLRRMVRAAADKPGVLYAFIVLDSPPAAPGAGGGASGSVLDMQTVSFVGGKPVFSKYMDTFPFPFYIVLRDTAALPRTLADLMRQWFELSSHGQ